MYSPFIYKTQITPVYLFMLFQSIKVINLGSSSMNNDRVKWNLFYDCLSLVRCEHKFSTFTLFKTRGTKYFVKICTDLKILFHRKMSLNNVLYSGIRLIWDKFPIFSGFCTYSNTSILQSMLSGFGVNGSQGILLVSRTAHVTEYGQ